MWLLISIGSETCCTSLESLWTMSRPLGQPIRDDQLLVQISGKGSHLVGRMPVKPATWHIRLMLRRNFRNADMAAVSRVPQLPASPKESSGERVDCYFYFDDARSSTMSILRHAISRDRPVFPKVRSIVDRDHLRAWRRPSSVEPVAFSWGSLPAIVGHRRMAC